MNTVRFQSPDLAHTRSIIELVSDTPWLDSNSEYAYALWCTHFAENSVVALRDNEVIGFLTGFRSPRRPETYFLWQTATKPRHGVAGLGVDMIAYAAEREISRGADQIEASVDEKNKAIRLLMKSLAKRLDGRIEEELLFPGSLLAGAGDDHHDETLMRICLDRRTDREPVNTPAPDHVAEEAAA
ncbi:GNAT family N-acetyltransferase [Thalassococcus sp. S3]|uniref:GNAT family N-acetyltransferase n=1 Tax=Thalassococcus sp. S3 TaxID=2017482 RepID=UPI0013EE7AD9|nr:GNAT family N-acetyltransferase [Thalassococcus sp. S3]